MYAPSLGAATTTAVLHSVALTVNTAFGPGLLLKPLPERKQRGFKIEFRGADGERLVANLFNGAALPL
jgi:hypothetical protein